MGVSTFFQGKDEAVNTLEYFLRPLSSCGEILLCPACHSVVIPRWRYLCNNCSGVSNVGKTRHQYVVLEKLE